MNIVRSYLASRLKGTPVGDGMVAAFNAAAVPLVMARRRITRKMHRVQTVWSHLLPQVSLAAKWLLTSTETENFTYRITPRNLLHISSAVSVVTGASPESVRQYIRELDEDTELAAHLAAHGERPFYARRVGWYAVARITKPAVIVETGVHKGVGATVLCAALRRNAMENASGRYFGTDIDPTAGALLSGIYAEHGRILHGDSLASLATLSDPIGLFINDSDHSAEYESREYLMVRDRLAPSAIIISDNAHVSDELMAFSRMNGRRFLFVREDPEGHWYRGAGIGFSFL